MSSLLVPARRRGHEFLDDPSMPAELRRRSVREIARSNTLFGGTRAALGALDRIFRRASAEGAGHREPHALTLLDVGTGAGDIPAAARRLAARRGVELATIGLDGSATLADASRSRTTLSICGDALALPFADRSVDIVLASQLLHHFEAGDAARVLAEMHRVARVAVVVSDLRRSRLAAAGFWLASFPLRYHRVTREDGVTSIFRGFTAGELRAMVRDAVGAHADVRRRLGWRVVASWSAVSPPEAPPFDLGPMPEGRRLRTVDETIVRAPAERIAALARDVERWPEHLAHYRFVRVRERRADGGGVVEMSANRPFGPLNWPTWWLSRMSLPASPEGGMPGIRFRHIGGITTGMDVEWSFERLPDGAGTRVRIVHLWDGPRWPLVGTAAATWVIGPVFVHGIASRTLAGLAAVAERGTRGPGGEQ